MLREHECLVCRQLGEHSLKLISQAAHMFVVEPSTPWIPSGLIPKIGGTYNNKGIMMIPPPIPIKPAMKAPTNPRKINNPAIKEWTVPIATAPTQPAIRSREGLADCFMADWTNPWFV